MQSTRKTTRATTTTTTAAAKTTTNKLSVDTTAYYQSIRLHYSA